MTPSSRTTGLRRALRVFAHALLAGLSISVLAATPANAQETAVQEAARRSAALARLPKNAARIVFGGASSPAAGEARSVGEYWKGCYAGGVQLPPVGAHWQVMRLSRNRNWGQPLLVSFLERFANTAALATGWPGILIGDMSQPRGGPMLTGHASHQLGIEADIWLRPMPAKPWNALEVDEVLSTDLLRADRKDVDPRIYTPQHLALLRAAASQPEVARVFVNAAIKKALCRDAGTDRAWLHKIRPAYGHTYHFHIRLACPQGQLDCKDQAPPASGDGCSKAELDYWLSPGALSVNLDGPGRSLLVTSLPKACQVLATAPAAAAQLEPLARAEIVPVPCSPPNSRTGWATIPTSPAP